jgi:hypothetical protein
MLDTEQKLAIVSTRACGLSYQQVQHGFERKFRKPVPTRANIRLLVNKFKRTGSVLDEKRSGRLAISKDDVQCIQQAIERSSSASICSLSNQIDIPRTTVWRALHFKLKKRVYHLQLRDYLNNTFRSTWIGRDASKHWAPCSPELTPSDFFARGVMNTKVYRTKVPELHDLWQSIHEAAQVLTPNMLRDVFRATVERWEQCLEMEWGQA